MEPWWSRFRYRCTLYACIATAWLLWLLGSPATEAFATSTPLAQLPNAAQRLTAYDGYVVFSQYEPSAGNWRLMVWHDGSIKALPVAARDMPFDADAGPGADGQAAIVYSLCTRDPPPLVAIELQSSEYVREPEWTKARGCRIYEARAPVFDDPDRLTPLGADPEIRIDPLRAGRQSAPSLVAATSFVSGTCGYVESRSPSVVGSSLLYATNGGGCERGPEEIFSSFTSYSANTRAWRTARLRPGLVTALAEDHGTVYWIKHDLDVSETSEECRPGVSACAGSAFTEAQDCDPTHGICTLMQTNGLSLGAAQHRSPGIFG